MKLDINGVECEVSHEMQDKLLNFFWSQGITKYQTSLDPAIKGGVKLVTRKILYDLEKKARKAGNEQAALIMRPPKGTDPNLHLMEIMRSAMLEVLSHATLTISVTNSAEGNPIVDDLAVTLKNQGEAGGQMADTGDNGIRENNIFKDVSYAASRLIS